MGMHHLCITEIEDQALEGAGLEPPPFDATALLSEIGSRLSLVIASSRKAVA